MAVKILMPALSPTMESGKIAQWLVAENEAVTSGDILAEIETDKAIVELEAIDDGVVGKILFEAGPDQIDVNQPIAVLLLDGEDERAADVLMQQDDAPVPETSLAPAPEVEPAEPQERQNSQPPKQAQTILPVEVSLPVDTPHREIPMREALRDALAEEMRRDEDVFIMGEEVAEYEGAYKVTQGLLAEFGGKRVIDTPITEHAIAGLGIGAAFSGLKPVVEFMTFNFAMQAIDQIVNSAAKTRYMSGGQISCPIVFRGPNGVASRVAAQHSQDYSSWYAHVPGLIVLTPANAEEAKGLLKAAIRDPNPVVFLEHELLYGEQGQVPDYDDFVLPIGQARIARAGNDVTLVAYARGVAMALQAAEQLAAIGLEAEVIDLRSLRPLDVDTVVASVEKTNRLVTIEEGWPICSVGSEIAAQVQRRAFDALDAPIEAVNGADVPMPYAENLERLALPQIDQIVAAAKRAAYFRDAAE
ncbi:MAG: pyruvate dehydrogenase complex E1 component subunit beta [Alphaproteobacteria bacterium]|nr:pyruvate dehydrogenase complex E1 component subunit beta [Alphaproteobacteria bacterium]